MYIEKQELLKIVRELPDQIDIEEVLHRLYLREKLEAAEQDVRDERLLTHEEVVAETARWFSQ